MLLETAIKSSNLSKIANRSPYLSKAPTLTRDSIVFVVATDVSIFSNMSSIDLKSIGWA